VKRGLAVHQWGQGLSPLFTPLFGCCAVEKSMVKEKK